jgi:hypothetical protein
MDAQRNRLQPTVFIDSVPELVREREARQRQAAPLPATPQRTPQARDEHFWLWRATAA